MEKKWIYLKSDNLWDILTLATVLSKSDRQFNVVRKSSQSQILATLPNVNVGFFDPDDKGSLTVIEGIEAKDWKSRCAEIAQRLGIKLTDTDPYMGFVKTVDYIERQNIADHSAVILYLDNSRLNVMAYDQIVRLLDTAGRTFISAGSHRFPSIRGCMDLRTVMDIPGIFGMRDKISFIITNQKWLYDLAESYNIRTYCILCDEKITLNGDEMGDVTQVANYINMKTNTK